MSEILTIKNFGPIKDATINLRRQMVFIGPQASGKSTIAKLISIFRTSELIVKDAETNGFQKHFSSYNIHNYFSQDTIINYENQDYSLNYEKGNLTAKKSPAFADAIAKENNRIEVLIRGFIETNKQLKTQFSEEQALKDFIAVNWKGLFSLLKEQVYIPAERILLSIIEMQPTILSNSAFPISFTEFANRFFIARTNIKVFPFDFFGVQFRYEDNKSKLYFDQTRSIPLSEAATGLQAIVPMILVIENLLGRNNRKYSFLVEEPEMNLYPTSQKEIIGKLISSCNKNNGSHDLIVTTHSPYVLSIFNNMLFADMTTRKNEALRDQIRELVPDSNLIKTEDFNAYYLTDGTAVQIFNEKTGLISTNELDDISIDLAGVYDQLEELYQKK